MTPQGLLEIALLFIAAVAAAIPLGDFVARVFSGGRTWLDPVLGPVERGFYRLAGVDAAREQTWRGYALAMLVFSAAGFLLLYVQLRAQNLLPLDPQGFDGVAPALAFNTAVSFLTNTDWQAYGGETTMSHLSQMAGLTVHNFLSAATGMALAAALVRGFARSRSTTVGNFWVDVTRATLYVLLPLSFVTAILLVALGMPQTLAGSVDATTLEGASQTISLGPVASQVAIKQLGTNGGGFFNANAAHPFENPSALSSLFQTWQMLVVSIAMVVAFGRMVGDGRQGRAVLSAMGVLLVAGTLVVYWAEARGTPMLAMAGLDPAGGVMEGKEVRFGLALSALWAAVTTGLSCGAVNAMHSSFSPIGGLVPLFLIQLGEILPGGVGSGLYGILVVAVITVFVAGLMVGRTPEYLGKRIEAREVKMAMLAILVLPVAILGFSAIAAVVPAGLAGLLNAGPHGLSEILYAYTSAAGNNGSAFAGLSANSDWYNTTLAAGMLLGRFAYIVPMLALAGSLAAKPKIAESTGSFPTHGPLFVGLLVGIILILGGLQFFPALALGPIAEEVLGHAGKLF